MSQTPDFKAVAELFDLPGALTAGAVSESRNKVGRTAKESIEYGLLCLNDADAEGAIAHFQKALEQGGEGAEVMAHLGAAYEASGLTSQAQRQYERALEMSRSGALEDALAAILRQEGRTREALEHLREAATLEPFNAYHRFRIAETLRGMGYRKMALQAVMEAIAIAPDDAMYRFWAGELASEMEDWPTAAEYLQAALELSPGDSALFEQAAIALWGIGKREEALRAAQLGGDIDAESTRLQALRRTFERELGKEVLGKPPKLEEYDREMLSRWLGRLGLTPAV